MNNKISHGIGVRSHKLKIYIGTDHAGFAMKEKLIPFIQKLGYEVVDCGAHKFEDNDDYPDFISPVAKSVALNPDYVRGIILGGSGEGEGIVANRFPNVRATVFYGGTGVLSKYAILILGRKHNDTNILSLGARFLSLSTAKKAVKIWLETPFPRGERHIRRIKKIEKISRDIKHNHDFK
jgi:ribose 5-phosphate isomerase B